MILTQDGADPHHADPLAHLQVTMPAFPRAYRALHEIAREAAGGRWVALGGVTPDTIRGGCVTRIPAPHLPAPAR